MGRRRGVHARPDTAVYVTAGVEFDVNWVPMESAYSGEVDVDGYEYHSVAGLAAHVRTVRAVDGRRPAAITDARPVQQRLMFELEAGASGVGPGVFAAFAVHDRDNYAMGNELPHAAAPASRWRRRRRNRPSRRDRRRAAGARLPAAQPAALRRGGERPAARPCVVGPQIEGDYEATAAIARKLRALATARTLKLNTAPTNVVFVPRLRGDEGSSRPQVRLLRRPPRVDQGVHLVGQPGVRASVPAVSVAAYSADGAYAAA